MRLYGREFRFSQLMKLASLAGATASPLLLGALRKGPLTAFDFAARTLETYRELTQVDPVPTTSLSEFDSFVESDRSIWIDLSHRPTAMTTEELALLCAVVKWKNPERAIEIGTLEGMTTLHISMNTSPTCRIFTVDLPPDVALTMAPSFSDSHLVMRAASRTQRVFGDDPKITQILQDSTTIHWEAILDRPVDFAFIDASHLYEHVRADTEHVMQVLAPGGVVMWHDYRPVEIRRGVTKHLRELRRNGLEIRRFPNTSLCIYRRPVHERSVENPSNSVPVTAA
jgi:predicted O-methyltransferase YrrM